MDEVDCELYRDYIVCSGVVETPRGSTLASLDAVLGPVVVFRLATGAGGIVIPQGDLVIPF